MRRSDPRLVHGESRPTPKKHQTHQKIPIFERFCDKVRDKKGLQTFFITNFITNFNVKRDQAEFGWSEEFHFGKKTFKNSFFR